MPLANSCICRGNTGAVFAVPFIVSIASRMAMALPIAERVTVNALIRDIDEAANSKSVGMGCLPMIPRATFRSSNAERNGGRISFFAAAGEFGRRGIWIGAAVAVLGGVYVALGFGQDLVRSAIWNFWQTSSSRQFIKNLIYFVFIFSFAMLRLWLTLLILTWGLKQSYIRGD